jgi:hypothetical protein
MLPGPFAYAERWDEKSDTYLGLAIERAVNAVVVIDSDSVIVTPAVADAHRPAPVQPGAGGTSWGAGDSTPTPDGQPADGVPTTRRRKEADALLWRRDDLAGAPGPGHPSDCRSSISSTLPVATLSQEAIPSAESKTLNFSVLQYAGQMRSKPGWRHSGLWQTPRSRSIPYPGSVEACRSCS